MHKSACSPEMASSIEMAHESEKDRLLRKESYYSSTGTHSTEALTRAEPFVLQLPVVQLLNGTPAGSGGGNGGFTLVQVC